MYMLRVYRVFKREAQAQTCGLGLVGALPPEQLPSLPHPRLAAPASPPSRTRAVQTWSLLPRYLVSSRIAIQVVLA